MRHFVDIQERKIIVKDNPNAYILRVPCVAGQNDGLRPAPFGIFDEIHEMTGNKEKAHLVIQNGLRKRTNTIGINITTAGVENSLAYRLYKYAKSIEAGEIEDEGFYFKIYEADQEIGHQRSKRKIEKLWNRAIQLLMTLWIVNNLKELFNKYQKMSSEDIF